MLTYVNVLLIFQFLAKFVSIVCFNRRLFFNISSDVSKIYYYNLELKKH